MLLSESPENFVVDRMKEFGDTNGIFISASNLVFKHRCKITLLDANDSLSIP
jgi:hypothetical protein